MVDQPSADSRPLPLAVQIQFQAAQRLGLHAEILDPEYNYLFALRGPARTTVFYAGRSPLNDSAAARICEDKYYTELVLRRAGLQVVHSVRCLSPHDFRSPAWAGRGGHEAGARFAARCGYPAVVKPNRMSHGHAVRLVGNEVALQAAVEEVWRCDYCALVQRYVSGLDVRLNFLDGEYLIGYARSPLAIVGDGRNSIRGLLAKRDSRFADDAFWVKATRDPAWRQRVVERGWDEDAVLPRGTDVHFEADILNLNRWAAARVVPEVSEAWRELCYEVGKALNLRHFGVDLRAQSLEQAPTEATVIEVNSSPLLTQLYRMGHREAAIAAQMKVLRAYFAL